MVRSFLDSLFRFRLLAGLLFAFSLNILIPASALAGIAECTHHFSPFVFVEFMDKARTKDAPDQKLYLYTANPDICASNEFHMGAECAPTHSLTPGTKVVIGFTCGNWSYVQREIKNKKGQRQFIKGWVQTSQLQKLPPTAADMAFQKAWKATR